MKVLRRSVCHAANTHSDVADPAIDNFVDRRLRVASGALTRVLPFCQIDVIAAY